MAEPPPKKRSKLGFSACGEHCCAIDCSHKRGTHDCHFYSFPSAPEWREKWITAIKRCAVTEDGKVRPGVRWEPKPHHRLCSCHFTDPPNPRSRRLFWNHVVPDVLPGSSISKSRPTSKSTNRKFSPKKSRKCLFKDDETTTTDNEEGSQAMDEERDNLVAAQEHCNVGWPSLSTLEHDHDYCGTVRAGRVAQEFDIMKKHVPEFHTFLSDFESVSKKAEMYDSLLSKGQILSLPAMKDDPKNMRYYTGFPSYSTFSAVFQYLKFYAEDMQYVSQLGKKHHTETFQQKPGPARVLSLEEEFFATLVRLRLGIPSKDCARRFGIAESTFSNIFNTWVVLIAKELERICSMPSTEKSINQQAACFDNFENVRIVLDCTEVFSQTPGNLDAHKQLHSNYKHHSTIKFLVGISPNGAITYVSKMWGGRASDKVITKDSDELLSALEEGDRVMVDRGFTIAEDLPSGVKLLIPPFKNRNTGQLTAEQLEYSEKISQARIHVERAMRAIKEYRLLEFEVKLAMINNYENIFKACAYLVNFKSPFLKRSV